MFRWNEKMVSFMRDACENTGYHKALAAKMAPYLTAESHICDAGCGLGYLSLALSPYVAQVTAVDQSDIACAVLRENIVQRGIGNITVRQGDIFTQPPAVPYDAMAFCFFGHISEICAVAKAQCSGKVFIMKKNYVNHRFSMGEHPTGGDGFEGAKRYLDELGIPYESDTLSLELGQPFRSWEDARRFFTLYNRDEQTVNDAFLQEHLVATQNEAFPFYMPHLRQIGWLMLNAKDIPTIQ